MTLYSYEIGTSTGNLSNLELLGLDPPFQDGYTEASEIVEGADGLVYGHGWAETSWNWGLISQDNYDILRGYCSGRSAIAYVRLLGPDNTWDYCKVVLVWPPQNPPANNGYIFGLTVRLRIITNYGESLP